VIEGDVSDITTHTHTHTHTPERYHVITNRVCFRPVVMRTDDEERCERSANVRA
jgi:hypothetical protein